MLKKTVLVLTISALILILILIGILGIWMQRAAALGSYTRLSYTLTDTRWAMVAANERYNPNYIVVVFTDNLT